MKTTIFFALIFGLLVFSACQQQNGTYSGQKNDTKVTLEVSNQFGSSTDFNISFTKTKNKKEVENYEGEMGFQAKIDKFTTNYVTEDGKYKLSYNYKSNPDWFKLITFGETTNDTIVLQRVE